LEPKLFPSNTTNTFEGNGNGNGESSSINKQENLNQLLKTCCCSLYQKDQALKNMQKMWSIID
jgi:hypothetical protein